LFSNLSNLRNFGINKRWRAGDTNTGGAVAKPFRSVSWLNNHAQNGSGLERWFAQLFTGLNLNYNQSQSFQPTDTAYNVFGDILPDPSGRTKDYGVTLNLFDDKLTARIARYDTLRIHARGSTGTIAGRTIGLDIPSNLTATTGNSLYFVAQQWFILQHPEWTLAQVQSTARDYVGLTPKTISLIGSGVSDVNEAESKGWACGPPQRATSFSLPHRTP
jgi:hypothetical protein